MNTKEVRICGKERNESEFIPIRISNRETDYVIDISNDGLRWEGPCVNQPLFSNGSLYKSLNELIYRGLIVDDSKDCFGIDSYPDLDIIEYCGCNWNNRRHGFCLLHDILVKQ